MIERDEGRIEDSDGLARGNNVGVSAAREDNARAGLSIESPAVKTGGGDGKGEEEDT